MSEERLPIQFFLPRPIDELKKEAGGSKDIPKWVLQGEDLEVRSNKLSSDFLSLSDAFNVHLKKKSIVPYVFVANIQEDASAKSRRKDIISLFNVSDNTNVIGLNKRSELVITIDNKREYLEISNHLKDYENNKIALSCIDYIGSFEPTIEYKIEEQSYKIKLIDFQNDELNGQIQEKFHTLLERKKINHRITNYTNRLIVFNVIDETNTALDSIKNEDICEAILSIEPMPVYSLCLDEISSERIIAPILPVKDKEYVTVGILDNGIYPVPQLSPWIVGKYSFYPEDKTDYSHGTFCAGVALYGDICEGYDYVGHNFFKIFDATVFPDTTKEKLKEDELIRNIKEAVNACSDKVKIWSLSLSFYRTVLDTKFSDFAIALDDLQTKNKIIICKSAGNCSCVAKQRIVEGADSVRSLVVGSVAHEKNLNDLVERDYPSPFSRVGPGPECIIKPEVCHYGGNAGIVNGEVIPSGVTSFDLNGNLCKSAGTSFSTPRVASLLAGIYQELAEDFDPLLLKALAVHSASYSIDYYKDRINEMGFGVPKNIRDILYNSQNESTLILKGKLVQGDKIDIMDFPMPRSLVRNGQYTGIISITLVYDPILDSTQGIEYCQSNIDIKFGSYGNKKRRDTTKRNIKNPIGRDYSKNLLLCSNYKSKKCLKRCDHFALRERQLIEYGDKYYPVKKYTINLEDLSKELVSFDKKWFLFIDGLFREHTERKAEQLNIKLSQKYCAIITICDPYRKANVYDEVKQQLKDNSFWHTNIKLTNDIENTINV